MFNKMNNRYILSVSLDFDMILGYFQEQRDIYIASAEDDGDVFS